MNIIEVESNGVKFRGIVIEHDGRRMICYGNNILFTVYDETDLEYYIEEIDEVVKGGYEFGSILVDYCSIPKYDKILNEK